MSAHLVKEIERLKRLVLSLGARVEESVKMATKAVDDLDPRFIHLFRVRD